LRYSDEASAKEEARRHIEEGNVAYSNADVVVKLSGWDADHTTVVAQACLSALKQLILSDKQLTGAHSVAIAFAYYLKCFRFSKWKESKTASSVW